MRPGCAVPTTQLSPHCTSRGCVPRWLRRCLGGITEPASSLTHVHRKPFFPRSHACTREANPERGPGETQAPGSARFADAQPLSRRLTPAVQVRPHLSSARGPTEGSWPLSVLCTSRRKPPSGRSHWPRKSHRLPRCLSSSSSFTFAASPA